jgi:hypothetical protein
MNVGTLNSIALNSTVANGSTLLTYTTDASLLYVNNLPYTTDAVLQATQVKTYTTDAVLEGGSIKFYSTDALLIIPFHDQAHWGQMIGNNIVRPVDPNRVATWSTNSRPASPVDGQTGRNVQTGKLEIYDEKSATWKDAAGNSL